MHAPETDLTFRGKAHSHATTTFTSPKKEKSTGSELLTRSTIQILYSLYRFEEVQKAPSSPPYKERRAAGRQSFSHPQQQGKTCERPHLPPPFPLPRLHLPPFPAARGWSCGLASLRAPPAARRQHGRCRRLRMTRRGGHAGVRRGCSSPHTHAAPPRPGAAFRSGAEEKPPPPPGPPTPVLAGGRARQPPAAERSPGSAGEAAGPGPGAPRGRGERHVPAGSRVLPAAAAACQRENMTRARRGGRRRDLAGLPRRSREERAAPRLRAQGRRSRWRRGAHRGERAARRSSAPAGRAANRPRGERGAHGTAAAAGAARAPAVRAAPRLHPSTCC